MQVVSWRNGGAAQDGFKTLVLTVAPPETEACTTLRLCSRADTRADTAARAQLKAACAHICGAPLEGRPRRLPDGPVQAPRALRAGKDPLGPLRISTTPGPARILAPRRDLRKTPRPRCSVHA